MFRASTSRTKATTDTVLFACKTAGKETSFRRFLCHSQSVIASGLFRTAFVSTTETGKTDDAVMIEKEVLS